MAFLPDEVKYLDDLAKEMVRRIENKDTSNEAAVAYSQIGKVCTRAMAVDAAQAAKRTTRATKISEFQAARQTRMAAKKGTNANTTTANQGQQRTQQRA